MKFKTKLWKRSEKSFASTIPHVALLSMDEEKNHEVIWEYDESIGKWTFELKEQKSKKTNSNNYKQKTNSKKINSEKTNSEKTNSEKTNSEKINSEKINSKKTNSKKTNSKKTNKNLNLGGVDND